MNEKRTKPKQKKVILEEPVEIQQISSVELKRNSKGGTEIKVKVYHSSPVSAMNEANQIFKALTKKHSDPSINSQ